MSVDQLELDWRVSTPDDKSQPGTGGPTVKATVNMLSLAASLAIGMCGLAQDGVRLYVIDFEQLAEGTQISDTYASLGAWFSIVGEPELVPIVAVEGDPTAAFTGSGPDTPMSSGSCGLTDPIINGDFGVGNDIAIAFDPPVTSVRLFVIDLDNTESVTVRAYDGESEVGSQTHVAGDSGTGDGVSTEFALAHENITRIEIDVPEGIGFAVDYVGYTRPCTGDECGPQIEIAQESTPGAGDFDEQVLGLIRSSPTTVSAAEFYAYGVPEGGSWNGQLLRPEADRSHLLLAETTDGMTLFIVHDRAIPDDPDGGRAEMRVELSGDPDGANRTVEDEPGDGESGAGYTGDPGDSEFTAGNEWFPCCTDGFALSGLDGEWTLLVQFAEVDGDDGTAPIEGPSEWFAYSADGDVIPLALEESRRFRLRLVSNPPLLRGDMNCDGSVDFNDIDPFITALISRDDYESEYPDCNWLNGDIDESGSTDFNDIDGFVECLINGACP
jgi:hypothetical protein